MKLPWTFSITTAAFTAVGVDDIPSLLRAAGIDRVEGSWRLHSDPDVDALAECGRRLSDAGTRIETFHLPFGPAYDISHFYEGHRRDAVAALADWIRAASAAGASIGIIHPSAIDADIEIEGIDRFLDALCRSLETLGDVAANHGMRLAVENLPPRSNADRFGAKPEHFTAIADRVGHAAVGFCLDTGHAQMVDGGARTGEFFNAMGGRLIAYHLADNAGDRDAHLAPGRGLVDWKLIFSRARDSGFTGTMCVETPPFAPGPRYAPEAWRQLVDDTAALAARSLEADAPS